MAYSKTTWVDRNVQYPTRYSVDGANKIIIPAAGTVTQAGTAFSAARMNNAENGIESAHIAIDALTLAVEKKYLFTVTQATSASSIIIDLSSYSGLTYERFYLSYEIGLSATEYLKATFNNVTTGVYDYESIFYATGNNNNVAGSSQTSILFTNNNSVPSGAYHKGFVDVSNPNAVFDYGTLSGMSHTNKPSNNMCSGVFRSAGTDITRMDIIAGTGNVLAGSKVRVYGYNQ
jgi:hypothetical protein